MSKRRVTIQLPHRFILKKYLSEIDSEGLVEAVFEAEIRSNHCLRWMLFSYINWSIQRVWFDL